MGEGQWGKNDASITAVDWEDKQTKNLYAKKNGGALGDNANDMVLGPQGCLYVAVTESRYVAKLDLSGKEVARYTPDDAACKPRCLYNRDGNLYVSEYGGRVVKLDTANLKVKGTVQVGPFPEQMSSNGRFLAVCNSDYNGTGEENTLSIINLDKFEVEKTIELPVANPQRILLHADMFYCVCTTYDENWNVDNKIVTVNPSSDWKTNVLTEGGTYLATVIADYGNDKRLLVADVQTDWSTNKTVTKFKYYYPSSQSFKPCTEKSFTDVLASAPVHSIQSIQLTDGYYVYYWYAILIDNYDAAHQPTGSALYFVRQADGEMGPKIDDTGCVFGSRVVTLGY